MQCLFVAITISILFWRHVWRKVGAMVEGWYYVRETMTGNHQEGPLSDAQLLELVNRGKIAVDQVIMHPKKSRGQWVAAEAIPALKQVFDGKSRALIEAKEARKAQRAVIIAEEVVEQESVIARYLTDGQDAKIVAKLLEKIEHILTPGEELKYLAHQKAPHILSPDCFALTSKRLIRFQGSLLGSFKFVDFQWLYLSNAHFEEGVFFANVTMMISNGQKLELTYVPKPQARAIYKICQQAELVAFEERRKRWVEDQRILNPQAQQSIVVNAGGAAPSQSAEDPVEKLGKLKKMLDAGLISQAEFDSTKAKILSAM